MRVVTVLLGQFLASTSHHAAPPTQAKNELASRSVKHGRISQRAQTQDQMMTFRRVLLAALAAPLAFGEYSYTYDYTDAPTAAPTSLTASPTTTGAPTRTDTYAPTRMPNPSC